MIRLWKTLEKHRTIMLFAVDAIVIVLGYILAFCLRLEFNFELFTHSSQLTDLMKSLYFVLAIHFLSMYVFKVNRSLWRYFSINEVARLVLADILSNLFVFITIIGLEIKYIRSVPVIATFIIIVGHLAIRVSYRLVRRYQHSKNKSKRAIIIGAGDAGAILAREVMYSERYQNKLIGYIDDDPVKTGKMLLGFPILGDSSTLKSQVEKYKVDIAYIAIPSATKLELARLLELCKEIDLQVKIMSYHEQNVDQSQPRELLRDVSIEDLLGRGEINLKDTQIKEYINQKIVLVTGAGGSIGSEICRQLLTYQPKQMILLDIYENNLYDLQQEILRKQRSKELKNDVELIYLIANVRERNRIDDIMKMYHPDVVFHAAAHKHVPLMEDSPKEAIKNNVLGTFNVVNSCIAHRVEKFILISTDKAVNPTNVMGATKRMCELIVQGMKDNPYTKIGAVRFGNVLGSHGSVIPLFKQQIASGGPVTVTDPDVIRYFMTIPEASQLVLQAGAYADHGEIFVLDMGKPVKILKLAEDLIQLSGFKPYKDIQIEFTGLRAGEKMFEELILDEEQFTKTENQLIFIAEPTKVTKKDLNDRIEKLIHLLTENVDERNVKAELFDCIKIDMEMVA